MSVSATGPWATVTTLLWIRSWKDGGHQLMLPVENSDKAGCGGAGLRQRQEELEFKASLGYTIRPCWFPLSI